MGNIINHLEWMLLVANEDKEMTVKAGMTLYESVAAAVWRSINEYTDLDQLRGRLIAEIDAVIDAVEAGRSYEKHH